MYIQRVGLCVSVWIDIRMHLFITCNLEVTMYLYTYAYSSYISFLIIVGTEPCMIPQNSHGILRQNTECLCVCVLVWRGKKEKVYACAQKNITGVLEGLDRAVHGAPWLWTYDLYCQTVWIYTNACMDIYTCACVSNACMYVYMCACVYVYVYDYVHLYVCVHLCVCACVCAGGVSIILMQIHGSAVESATHALYIYIHLCICKWMRVSCTGWMKVTRFMLCA